MAARRRQPTPSARAQHPRGARHASCPCAAPTAAPGSLLGRLAARQHHSGCVMGGTGCGGGQRVVVNVERRRPHARSLAPRALAATALLRSKAAQATQHRRAARARPALPSTLAPPCPAPPPLRHLSAAGRRVGRNWRSISADRTRGKEARAAAGGRRRGSSSWAVERPLAGVDGQGVDRAGWYGCMEGRPCLQGAPASDRRGAGRHSAARRSAATGCAIPHRPAGLTV